MIKLLVYSYSTSISLFSRNKVSAIFDVFTLNRYELTAAYIDIVNANACEKLNYLSPENIMPGLISSLLFYVKFQ
jgi:hypothetical protein